jgi:RNA polymerase sigma-70 factor, ECF subfamily
MGTTSAISLGRVSGISGFTKGDATETVSSRARRAKLLEEREEGIQSQAASTTAASVEHVMSSGPARTDFELLTAFQEGSEQAFAELYTRRKGEVYTYCLRMLGNDADGASDAFQETFIKVFEKAKSFRAGTNVMGWLFMIARNTCLNVHRSKRSSEALDDHHSLVSSDRSLGPEHRQEQEFLRGLLERTIAALPEEFREPFILREFDGFSYPEIAEMTGTTLAMTKVRIHRAKQRMREMLKPFLSDSADSLDKLSSSFGPKRF